MKVIGTGTKTLFATSRLEFCLECLFAILFFPFVVDLGLATYFYLPTIFLAIALSIFCLPIIYGVINNTRFLTTGKYHIPLIISTLGFSFFSVLLFSISTQNTALKIAALFISCFFALTFFFVYTYVGSSIGARLFVNMSIARLKTLFAFVGSLVFIAAFILSDKFLGDTYRTTAAICGCVLILAGMTVYLSTHIYMPRFIKVNEPVRRGFKMMYTRFFASFTLGENRRVYIGLFFNSLSILILAFCIRPIARLFGVDNIIMSTALFIFFAVISIIDAITSQKVLTISFLKIGVLICSILAAAVIILRMTAVLDGLINIAAFLALPLLVGTASGISGAFIKAELAEVRERSNSTPGIIMNIKNIINVVAFVSAFILSVLLSLIKDYSLYFLMGVFVTAAFVAFAISSIKKKYLTLEIPDEDV